MTTITLLVFVKFKKKKGKMGFFHYLIGLQKDKMLVF